MMNKDIFTCAKCGDTFSKDIPEEEARVQLKKYFGDVSVEDCELVCDECWERIKP